MIVRLSLVKKRDAIPNPLAWQEYKNMLLIGRPDAKTIQFQIVGEQYL
jgi:hypothetical protein